MSSPIEAYLTRANSGDSENITGTDIGNKRAIDTYIQGGNVAASSAGAANGKTSAVVIDETDWFLLPAVPEGTRKGLGLQNYSGVAILVSLTDTNPSNVGVTVEDRGERFYDIQAPVYARRKSGSGSITLIVEELY